MADGTRKCYERDTYRCYRKINDRGGCQGKSTYVLDRIENDVLFVVHQYFANIRTSPTAQMLTAAKRRTNSIDEKALVNAEEALKKAQNEMAALEEETVKALTGESKLDINFINGLIPKRKANLEKATEEVERLRAVIADAEKKNNELDQELKMILSWADAFDTASYEVKRSIISALIERIEVYDDYRLDIHFRITAEQFLGKAA